jgi:hypothetical protein
MEAAASVPAAYGEHSERGITCEDLLSGHVGIHSPYMTQADLAAEIVLAYRLKTDPIFLAPPPM